MIGFSDCTVQRPAQSIDALMQHWVAQPKMLRQMLQGASDAIVRIQHSASLVLSLNSWLGPSAVRRLVMSISVNTIQRMLPRGSSSHIAKEGSKIIPPSVAHGNSTRSVSLVIRAFRVFASGLHVGPCEKLRGVGHAMRLRPLDKLLGPKASAGMRMLQVRARNVDNSPAVTQTAVERIFRSFGITNERLNGQSSVAMACVEFGKDHKRFYHSLCS